MERDWQRRFDVAVEKGTLSQELLAAGLPEWVQGVRVIKDGPFRWSVMLTPNRGR